MKHDDEELPSPFLENAYHDLGRENQFEVNVFLELILDFMPISYVFCSPWNCEGKLEGTLNDVTCFVDYNFEDHVLCGKKCALFMLLIDAKALNPEQVLICLRECSRRLYELDDLLITTDSHNYPKLYEAIVIERDFVSDLVVGVVRCLEYPSNDILFSRGYRSAH